MTPVELGYAAAWRLIRTLPRPAAAALFRVGADRAHRRGAASVRRLAANLRRVVGPDLPAAEFDRLTRDAVRSYARYWMEMFRLPSLSRQQRLAGFHLAGAQMLAANVAAGRGSVVALPHAGNWDAAGAWVAANDWPLTTVAERLRPEGVYNRFVAVRQRLGMEIVPASGGPRPPFDVLIDRLAAGHVVPLLADRDLSARGVEVSFFGGRTRMPAGPALLALRTGAPLYVTTMWFEPDRAHGALDGPVPLPDPSVGPLDVRVRLLTQQIADRLAVGIARHPQDWHMMQRLWLDERPDPDPDRDRSGSSATGPG
ncbi:MULTISPECIES: phosphatidylinositol mannoside acyltransferase [unclassified Solwaraspora]|uniref:phosphatidylinositol mannoside acyltransferase n=1 Tax=unclassified Solwaraspora TaxID=2627926 RepID=UPI00248C6712|nr:MULTISPECIES: phosphatidylinositol mannoside acyltransferase [unclassified Solwaraspora]WBB99125.1 phosphatidylinositol mannoside acyltransferase [Solwaraspora sp. WMMA2059]WBC22322.1 phosphatidylinositol mannoside acyltransferase [Solwaraspora sp. WMMA2080]WJK35628.1 phosphatidylinositol mannoside acyltransferase [Solwaraspora sp. WMMA2065]